jgi:hypothetical protein
MTHGTGERCRGYVIERSHGSQRNMPGKMKLLKMPMVNEKKCDKQSDVNHDTINA